MSQTNQSYEKTILINVEETVDEKEEIYSRKEKTKKKGLLGCACVRY